MIYDDRVLVDSPLGYWRVSDTGLTATDASGNLPDAAPVGGVTTGQEGALFHGDAAIVLDGVDDFVDLPDGFADLTSGFTIELWVRPHAWKSMRLSCSWPVGPIRT